MTNTIQDISTAQYIFYIVAILVYTEEIDIFAQLQSQHKLYRHVRLHN